MKNLTNNCSRQIYSWWLHKFTELGHLPGRQHFDAVDFKQFLPHVFIVDVEPGPRFRFRLYGSYNYDTWGADATGKYVDASTFGTCWQNVQSVFERVTNNALAIATHEHVTAKNSIEITVEVVRLPLARDGRTVDMVLGTLSRIGKVSSEAFPKNGRDQLIWTIQHETVDIPSVSPQ